MGIGMFWNEFRKVALVLNKNVKNDFEFIWRHRNLKSAKEKYITAIIAKALEKQNPKEKWWFTQTEQEPLADFETWRAGKIGSFYLTSIGKGGEEKVVTLTNSLPTTN